MSNYCDIGNKEVRRKVLAKYGGKCAYCGCVITLDKFNIDHIVPLRRHLTSGNGENTMDNYNPSCQVCNTSKASFDLETWREEIGLKVQRLNKFYSLYRIVKSYGLVVETNNRVTFYFERHG